MQTIKNQTFPQERALYASKNIILEQCSFEGKEDGESALKECDSITAVECTFKLRYPFWHTNNSKVLNCSLTQDCRAAFWYCNNINIEKSKLHGIKALRECRNVAISECDIISPEFGWFSSNIALENCTAQSEYFMLQAKSLNFSNFNFKGKYSFQYIQDSVFENCIFDTKDAFWHAQNIVVKNSIIKGEYLAWYSDGLTLENCVIEGTQPLCYCNNLKLINCQMNNTDLCFEKSHVDATITTHVISIKNPYSGNITVPSVNQIIIDDKTSKATISTLN